MENVPGTPDAFGVWRYGSSKVQGELGAWSKGGLVRLVLSSGMASRRGP